MSAPTMPVTTADRVDDFLAHNPLFINLCADYAREFLRETRSSRIGMQAVIERVRWERAIQLKTDSFKVNNSFEPYLARLTMLIHPDLTDVFVTRSAPLADEWAARRVENDTDPYSLFPEPRGGQR